MIGLLGRLGSTVESRTRKLRESRQNEIANQFLWLSDRERRSMIHRSYLLALESVTSDHEVPKDSKNSVPKPVSE